MSVPYILAQRWRADAGIPEEKFRKSWRATETERTIGNLSLEEILGSGFLRENNSYSEEKLKYIAAKRIYTKEETFRHLHKEIIPLLMSLKEENIQIGLISNCFSEEAKVIKKSILYPYFDVPLLSYDEDTETRLGNFSKMSGETASVATGMFLCGMVEALNWKQQKKWE